MKLDDLTGKTGEWLRGESSMSDVVISSRVRLARNIAGYPFLSTASDSERAEVYRLLADEISAVVGDVDALLVDMDEADDLERQLLVERHLISRQHAEEEGSRGVTIWPDERRALMINEEDHLRIQGLRSGLQLEGLWEDVTELDDALSRRLDFAYDEQLGYLTACPTNVGTGIRVSIMLHLPAMRLTKEIDRVIRAARDMRLAVRGLYGEGTDAVGDFYQVSNQTTLGKSEQEIIQSFEGNIIPKIVGYERTARTSLAQDHQHQLDDRIWRAHGALASARTIGTEETLALLSHIRMGIHMGRFDLINIQTLNDLFLHIQPAHLQKMAGRSLDGAGRSVFRAQYLRDKLAV